MSDVHAPLFPGQTEPMAPPSPVPPEVVTGEPTRISAPEIVNPPGVVKLDLGCGNNVRAGFDGVDLLAESAKHRVDLFKFPWPFESDSVDEVHCSHFIEHIPARDIEPRDLNDPARTDLLGQDMLLAFFDEVYRILKKDGSALIIWPALKSERAFQDPTHRRFIPQGTMGYLSRNDREAMLLTHYRVKCDFAITVVHTMPSELALLHPEAQARRFNENWNTTFDYHATLHPKGK